MTSFQLWIRERRGTLSQEEFAEHLGVRKGTYSSWEQGRKPGHEHLLLVSRKLGVSTTELLEMLVDSDPPDSAVDEESAARQKR